MPLRRCVCREDLYGGVLCEGDLRAGDICVRDLSDKLKGIARN